MSFLDSYLSKFKLDAVSDSVKSSLKQIEARIAMLIKDDYNNTKFDQAAAQFGPQLADVAERFAKQFATMPEFTLKGLAGTFRFVINIGTEVYQIVENIKHLVVSDDMTPEEKHNAKVEFGQYLTYFVWTTVNPLEGRFDWLPFKKALEKKVVFWISKMALDYTVDLLAAGSVQTMATGEVFVKALP